jgi:hypothetical protein
MHQRLGITSGAEWGTRQVRRYETGPTAQCVSKISHELDAETALLQISKDLDDGLLGR